MLLELISKFNDLSNTKGYNILFFLIGAIVFILSYVVQIVNEKSCNSFLGEIVRSLHHLCIYFIFYGFLAPISILWFMLIILIISIFSWTSTNNKCFLTTFENNLCKMNKNYIFHDLSYYLTRKLDTFMIHNRIKIYFIVCIIVLLRLYDYYIVNKHKKIKVQIQGHRGARGDLPENTLAAFKYVIENNIDFLELDLQITKDNEIIIYHNKSINTEICSGVSRPIKTLTLKEIKEYDCGSKKNIKFPNQQLVPGERIPTFIELINLIQTEYKYKKIKMNIEIKTETSLDADDEVYNFSKKLIDILHKYNITDDIIIQSFDTRALKYVKEIDPSITTSYLIEDKLPNIDSLINTSKQLGVKIISPDYKLIDKQIVKKLQENGFEVLPWTINDLNTFKKNIDYGVDGIITDYPKQMNDYLNDYLKK
jgi:glycerophosphoryl diester phosphodiesterase